MSPEGFDFANAQVESVGDPYVESRVLAKVETEQALVGTFKAVIFSNNFK